jgi:hypothetical protein
MWRAGLQVGPNHFPHETNVFHLPIPKSTSLNISGSKKFIPLQVLRLVIREAMLSSVQLDIVARLSAVEVQVIFSNLVLPAEFVPRESAIAQQPPQLLFH